MIGSLQQDDGESFDLIRGLNITVVAASYRLAPERRGSDDLDDLLSAYRDVIGRAGDFGIDPARIEDDPVGWTS